MLNKCKKEINEKERIKKKKMFLSYFISSIHPFEKYKTL